MTPLCKRPEVELAVEAMQAGLSGERLPDFGRLTPSQLALVNAIYDAARNRRDGERVVAHRVKR